MEQTPQGGGWGQGDNFPCPTPLQIARGVKAALKTPFYPTPRDLDRRNKTKQQCGLDPRIVGSARMKRWIQMKQTPRGGGWDRGGWGRGGERGGEPWGSVGPVVSLTVPPQRLSDDSDFRTSECREDD